MFHMETIKYVSMMWRLRCCEVDEERKMLLTAQPEIDNIIEIIHKPIRYSAQRKWYIKQGNLRKFFNCPRTQLSTAKRKYVDSDKPEDNSVQNSLTPPKKRNLLSDFDPGPPTQCPETPTSLELRTKRKRDIRDFFEIVSSANS